MLIPFGLILDDFSNPDSFCQNLGRLGFLLSYKYSSNFECSGGFFRFITNSCGPCTLMGPGFIPVFSLPNLFFDIIVNYLLSCLIVWVYDKVKKK